jgi:hypothetical protein
MAKDLKSLHDRYLRKQLTDQPLRGTTSYEKKQALQSRQQKALRARSKQKRI